MTDKSVFREAWSPELTSQWFPVSCFWCRGFVPHRKWNLTLLAHQNTGKENRNRKNFFATLISTLGRFNRANKKNSVIYTLKVTLLTACSNFSWQSMIVFWVGGLGYAHSLLSCLSVKNRTRCLADFLSCFSEGKRYLFNHFSSSHGKSRSKRTKPMSCRPPRHVTWSKSSVMLFFDYFEQVTRRSIRLTFSLF